MHRLHFGLVCLVLIPFLASCGSSSPEAPSVTPINLTGTWTGDLTVEGNAARMTWMLTQPSSATTVTGTVLVLLPSGTVLLNGSLSGTLNQSSLSFTFTVGPGGIPSQPSCTGQVTGTATATVAATSMLAGNFTIVTSSCPAPVQNGPFALTRT